MAGSELLDPFVRLLADICPPAQVRAVEDGASTATLWQKFEESGFLDALVLEAAGGAGLALTDIGPLVVALGRYAVPLPVAETMVARALLAEGGKDRPSGPIALGDGKARPTPFAKVASHLVVQKSDRLTLHELGQPHIQDTGVSASLAANVRWTNLAAGIGFTSAGMDIAGVGALLHAAIIAGAADRLLEMTVAYANERSQFGKPIGRQQAIQQQLAIMAEQTVAARMAAAIGFGAGMSGDVTSAAIAKQRTSAVASEIANIAHAVHGAIGISAEHNLHLFTRRLREARLAFGAEGYWAERLGGTRLSEASLSSVDFLRSRVMPTERKSTHDEPER